MQDSHSSRSGISGQGRLILILGLLTAIGPLSIDMYLPAFPSIATDLRVTVEQVGYSLSSFFIGVCVGQLFSGPLLDRFGRKRPLCIGLSLYVAASVGCSLSSSVEALSILRCMQALGGCVAMIAPAAIVRDVFPVERSARVFSMLILILGVSPILAPTIGGYITEALGWKPIFLVLAFVASLILLLVAIKLPETGRVNPAISLHPAAMVRNFRAVLSDQQFTAYAFSGSIASAGLFAYLAGSPYVFMEIYGLGQRAYGWIFGLIAAGLITCSQLNNLLLRRSDSARILKAVLTVQAVLGLVLFAGTSAGVFDGFGFTLVTLLFLSCQGFTFPNSAAMAMAPFSTMAGSASALMGAMQMAFGALSSTLVGLLFDRTAVPLVGIMAFCCVCGLLVLLAGQRRLRKRHAVGIHETAEGH